MELNDLRFVVDVKVEAVHIEGEPPSVAERIELEQMNVRLKYGAYHLACRLREFLAENGAMPKSPEGMEPTRQQHRQGGYRRVGGVCEVV